MTASSSIFFVSLLKNSITRNKKNMFGIGIFSTFSIIIGILIWKLQPWLLELLWETEVLKLLLTASSSRSLRAGVGRDRVSEQRSSCPRPSGHPALLLHHQCCPQQSQHHLDGDPAVQRQPTRAGTDKNYTPMEKKKKINDLDLS